MQKKSHPLLFKLAGAMLLFVCGDIAPAHSDEGASGDKLSLGGGSGPVERGNQIPWFGGHLGSATTLGAEYIYGIQGRTGVYVDSLAFKYWDSRDYRVSMSVGGSGGTAYDVECDDEYWAVGVAATYSVYIHRMALICRNAHNMEQTTDYVGGPGGVEQKYICPVGKHLAGFQVQSGIYLDGFQPFCKDDPIVGMPRF